MRGKLFSTEKYKKDMNYTKVLILDNDKEWILVPSYYGKTDITIIVQQIVSGRRMYAEGKVERRDIG